jgi:YD repeat-containing protein
MKCRICSSFYHQNPYTWSQRGQLLAETIQGVDVRTFTYDGAGHLVEATVFTLTTKLTYNGLGARVAVEVVGYGTTTVTLDYAGGNAILAETTITGTVQYLYGRDCLGELRDDEWLYYQHDGNRMVRQGTDAEGDVVSTWLFDPDGTMLEGPDGPVSHLICGGVYDWSTGLIYRGGRYFDPSLGIWLALAPLAVVQSWRRKKRRGVLCGLALALFLVGVSGMLTGCLPPPTQTPTSTPPPTLTPTCTEIATVNPTWTPSPTPTNTPTPTTSGDCEPCITQEAIVQAGGVENYLKKESDACTLARVSMGESHENGYDRQLVMWIIKMRTDLGYGNSNTRGANPPYDRWGASTSIKQEALNPAQFETVREAYTVTNPEDLPATDNIRAMLSPTDAQLPEFQSTLQMATTMVNQPLSSMPERLRGFDGFLAYGAVGGWTGAKDSQQLAKDHGPTANFYNDQSWIDNIHFGLVSCEWVRENNSEHPLMDLQCPGTATP